MEVFVGVIQSLLTIGLVSVGVWFTTWKVIREIWGTQKVLFFEINRLWKRP
jgi:hypothetical protein